MKEFLENVSFGVGVNLYIPPLSCKIHAHNMTGVRSLAVIITEGLYVCTYVCIGAATVVKKFSVYGIRFNLGFKLYWTLHISIYRMYIVLCGK